jgi:hypothetical protein
MKKISGLFAVVLLICLGLSSYALALDIYDEDIERQGRYAYAYPETSSIEEIASESYNGQNSIKITLDANTYSGAAVGNYPISDLAEVKAAGYLEFWVKGLKGNEMFQIALIDCDNIDGNKVELRLPVSKYAKILPTWQKVVIPLSDFGEQGVYWDGSQEVSEKFNWHDVVEIKFLIPPLRGQDNVTFYVDKLEITK